MTFTRDALTRLAVDPTRQAVEAGQDLEVEMSFASNQPVQRFFGIEILDCSPGAVRLGRLNDGGSLLFNHDWNTPVGHHVPNSVRLDADRVMRGTVRVSWAADNGRTVRMVEGGHLTKTSVGYEIHKLVEHATSRSGEAISREISGRAFAGVLKRCQRDGTGDVAAFRRALDAQVGVFDRASGEPVTYRVTDWEPLENSLVTVPADPSVGEGRAHEQAADRADDTPGDAPEQPKPLEITVMTTEAVEQKHVDPAAAVADAIKADRARVSEIEALGDTFAKHGVADLVREAKAAGASVADFRAKLLGHIAERGSKWEPSVGMAAKEVKQFSVMRAITAMASGDWSKAGLEREASEAAAAIASRAGVQRQGTAKSFYLPAEIQRRDLTVASATSAGNLVGTDLRPQDFIDLVRARSLLAQLGATKLSGLVGDADIPKLTGAATAYWLATESTGITPGDQTVGLLQLRPKNLGALTKVSRQMQLQSSPSVDAMVMTDLAAQLALATDKAGFTANGTGGAPTGILSTSGIGSVVGTSLDWAKVLEFQTDVANANSLNANCKYVSTPSIGALLATRQKFSGTDTPLWTGNILDGNLGGFGAHTTTNMTAGTMVFGDFSQVIMAEWGVLEIDVNPYDNFAAGITGIRAFQTVDIGVRIAGAFSAASSIT